MTERELPWTRALVVGLGRSGLAAAALLRALGVEVRAYDARARVDGLPAGIEPFLGEPQAPDAAFAGIDLLVLSPGVPPEPFLHQRERLAPGAAVHGELGLALWLVDAGVRGWSPVPTVLVTGTNGKSTVTALTGVLVEVGGLRPFTGGNLGVPLCERLLQGLEEGVPWVGSLVLECSSYQLETLPRVRTDVAMILNITPDHLDRYPSMEAYARTKARVFDGLDARGLAILDASDAWTEALRPAEGPGAPAVALVGDPAAAALVGEGAEQALVLHGHERYPRSSLRLAGGHNARNALFALLAARHLGVSVENCLRGMQAFEGLPHRMVHVRELDGVAYYDDSKATNVVSALAGLAGLDRPFVLIAGGMSKGDDLGPLRELLARRGRGLVVVGQSAERFAVMGQRVGVSVVHAGLMDDAVAKARALAKPGEAVVLAPCCASFDQYKSYAHRGEMFAAAVRGLA
jgi:UDP-N-acetylmuramoylalanine--D-glutamate ligase